MRELTVEEVDLVDGGVSQSDVVNTNLTIIGIGAAAVFAGMTAPAWGPIALIGLSVGMTGTYLYEQMAASE